MRRVSGVHAHAEDSRFHHRCRASRSGSCACSGSRTNIRPQRCNGGHTSAGEPAGAGLRRGRPQLREPFLIWPPIPVWPRLRIRIPPRPRPRVRARPVLGVGPEPRLPRRLRVPAVAHLPRARDPVLVAAAPALLRRVLSALLKQREPARTQLPAVALRAQPPATSPWAQAQPMAGGRRRSRRWLLISSRTPPHSAIRPSIPAAPIPASLHWKVPVWICTTRV